MKKTAFLSLLFGKTALLCNVHVSAGLTTAPEFVNIISILNGYKEEEYFSACFQRAAGRCKAVSKEKEGSF